MQLGLGVDSGWVAPSHDGLSRGFVDCLGGLGPHAHSCAENDTFHRVVFIGNPKRGLVHFGIKLY